MARRELIKATYRRSLALTSYVFALQEYLGREILEGKCCQSELELLKSVHATFNGTLKTLDELTYNLKHFGV